MENGQEKLEVLTIDEFAIEEQKRYNADNNTPLYFANREISKEISISKSNPNKEISMSFIEFYGCIFKERVHVAYEAKVRFIGCSFLGLCEVYYEFDIFRNCRSKSSISLYGSDEESLDLSGVEELKTVSIRGNFKIISGIGKIGNTCNQLFLSNSLKSVLLKSIFCFDLRLDIFPRTDNAGVMIQKSSFGVLGINLSSFTFISLNSVEVNEFLLSGDGVKDLKFSVNDTKISHNLSFNEIKNNGNLSFRNLSIGVGCKISIVNSDLGRTDFIISDFSKGVVNFKNSKLAELFLAASSFPAKVLTNEIKDYGQRQLFFGQMSMAAQRQGDTVKALEYAANEVRAHYDNTRWFSVDFFQKFNLFLNFISNDFGKSWIRGFIFSSSVGLLFFTLLLVSTEKFVFAYPTIDHDLIPVYLKFMNPLRFFELSEIFKYSKFKGISLAWGAYMLDFLGRVFIAYGYYQTIQAFRRFGKK